MDHASHTIVAVCRAEVRVIATLIKGVLIDETRIGKNSRTAVGIIRRAKLSVGNARSAARYTVAAGYPSPSHCVARCDADFVRHKRKTLSYRHIESPARSRWHAIWHWLSILTDNPDGFSGALFLCRNSDAFIVRFS